MLGIGFKFSDTPLPAIERPLREYILHEYSSDASTDATRTLSAAQEDALAQFFQLKQDVDLVRTPSAISRHVLLRYYGQLERFASRFPCDPTSALRLQFTWNDSFCPRKKITQPSIKFEQAAVLFNYGALESQLGVQTDRSDVDGLKAACRHFMLAAGAFLTVKDHLVNQCLGSRTPDMSVEGLSMLTQLMLAQAQACFYEKAIKDQMKDAIKAKLVHQALEFYGNALEFAQSSALNGTIDRTWAIHIHFQVLCMKAATQFWQAKAAKEVALQRGVGYGEEIARLMMADAECQEAIKAATQNKLPPSLIQSAKNLQKVVVENLHVAQKDNASVYLDRVPKISDLPAIGKASMVKPLLLTPEEIATELNGVDLFEQFVPNAVRRRAAEVKDQVLDMLQTAKDHVSKSNEAAKQQLHALGLPASIEAFEKTSDNGIPTTIWRKIEHIQQTNAPLLGPDAISKRMHEQIQNNLHTSDNAERKLRAIEGMLSEEEVQDNICRQNYGPTKWTRATSSTLGASFRADVDRYYRLVKEAKASDRVVKDKLQAHAQLLECLTQRKRELDAQLPPLEQEHSSCNDEITMVSTLLLRLSQLVDEKQQLVQDFEASYDKFNVLPVLLQGGDAAAMESAVASETQFFETHFMAKVHVITMEEQQLLQELVGANKQFEAKKANDPILHARQAFLQQLSDAVDVCEQLQSHVKEGKKFYDDLVVRIGELEQTVADHCAARDLEKREMELNLRADEEMKARDAQDAQMAEQMMRKMQIQSPPPPAVSTADDEALARQLAGNVPQQYSAPPPPSYDYVASQASSAPSYSYGTSPSSYQPPPHHQPPPQHPYAQYQQYGGPQYANFYSQQPHAPAPQAQPQPAQPPQYYQYPGYQQPPPPQQQHQPPQYGNAPHPQYPRSPPGSSV